MDQRTFDCGESESDIPYRIDPGTGSVSCIGEEKEKPGLTQLFFPFFFFKAYENEGICHNDRALNQHAVSC